MSSSLTYTFTKLRSLPSSVNKCLRSSPNSVVSRPNASPTVPALTSVESRLPAYGRSGVGIITFTLILFSQSPVANYKPLKSLLVSTPCQDGAQHAATLQDIRLSCRVIANGNFL